MNDFIGLMRSSPAYVRLWLSQVISLMGDWFSTIALYALVVSYNPENGAAAITLLLLARFLPPLLLSPYAGVLIDRFDRKTILLWSNGLRAVVVLGFQFTLNDAGWLPVVYGLTVMQFALSALYEPAQTAIMPSLVPRDRLIAANTYLNVVWTVMLALGAALGGVVADQFGTRIALLIDALSFVVAALLILPLPSVQPNAARDDAPAEGVTMADGLRYLRARPPVIAAMLVKTAGSLGNADTLITVFATQIYIIGVGGQLSLGILYAIFGVFSFLLPLIANRYSSGSPRDLRRWIAAGFGCIVIGWLVLTFEASFLVVCAAFAFRAMGGSLNWTYSTILLQKSTPDGYLGRVFAWDYTGYNLATVLSIVVHGALIEGLGVTGIPAVVFGTGIISMISLGVWLAFVRRTERHEGAIDAAPAVQPAGD